MKPLFFLRIRRFPRIQSKNEQERKGTLTVFSVFLFLLFSSLGLGMLHLTRVYLKTSGFRKNTVMLEQASENGIKQGFDHLHRLLSQAVSPVLLSETETSQLWNDSLAGGIKCVQRVLEGDLPLRLGETWERLTWESVSEFQFAGIREAQEYFLVEYNGETSGTGKVQGFIPEKTSTLDSKLEILAGHIPLPAVPFLLDKEMTGEQRSSFLEQNDIHMIPSEDVDLPAAVAFSDGGLLPEQAEGLLAETLKIDIFYPQDLSPARLRMSLGLEVNDEPIPEGVYLARDDLGLGGVFVQGDLDEMILAIRSSFQIVSFRQGSNLWILQFSPEEGKTVFVSPAGILAFDFVPLGIIIVNGKILSLGGGYEDSSGRILLAGEEEIPCVLRGVNLTIVSSDEITLSSHLIYQGVTWQDGVPYLKDTDSQLVIHATGQDLLSGEELAGQIIIGENSPEDLKVQASLAASGKGIAVSGEDKRVQVLGSLQTSELLLNGNELNIKFDDRFFRDFDFYFQNAPTTAQPVLCVSRFKIMGWRENL